MKPKRTDISRLRVIFGKMNEHFGPRNWWPGETAFEICIGAILTQSVSWRNVAKAINNLKTAGLLDLQTMHQSPAEEIENCIVPTMYYRAKTRKLKAFVDHIVQNYNGHLELMLQKDVQTLRKELLNIYGIGPETADSIILYAAGKPVFVVDAYTKRIFSRLGFFREDISYDELQRYFMQTLPPDTPFFNEFHALIVGVGNRFCSNKKPKCPECPVGELCGFKKK